MKTETVLKLPGAAASLRDLRDHFFHVAAALACMDFSDRVRACQACLRDSENTHGKQDNPAGRARFCSAECEDTRKRYDAARKAAA